MKNLLLTLLVLPVVAVAEVETNEHIASIMEAFGKENVVVIDLTDRQVVCGYSDVNSDINRARYDDDVCRHFGHLDSIGAQCGHTLGQDEGEAKILTQDSKGVPQQIPYTSDLFRNMGFYKYIICLKGNAPVS